MRKLPLLWPFLSGALLLSISLNVWLLGQTSQDHRPKLEPARVKELANCLCLDAEQCQILLDCARSCAAERQDLATQAAARLAQIQALLERPETAPGELERLSTELGQLHAQEVLRLARSILEVRRTLTPEQRAQLADLDLSQALNNNGNCK